MIAGTSGDAPRTIEDLIAPGTMHRLDRLDLLSRKAFPGRLPGERRSKKRGRSVEFEDYRPYVPGDDLRHIDWNVFARLDRLFIKIFLEEEDLGLHLILDASASMRAGEPDKFTFAQRLAMALGYLGLVANNRVSMTVFGDGRLRRLGERRGRRHVQTLGQFILGLPPGNDADGADPRRGPRAETFDEAMRLIAASRTGKGVAVLLSDFLFHEGYEGGLRYLAGGRDWDVYCLQILAPDEIDPERAAGGVIAGDLRLTDVETGADAEVTVTAALLAQYRRRLESFCNGLAAYCAARDMTHLLVRTDTPIEQLLLDDLRQRGMLR
ncbi:MAG: DUF58 domain-containing protein [Planctomycetota bacterium]|nr:MAG: DUF58 domain-containing protein [Planctomycetota bacterium]